MIDETYRPVPGRLSDRDIMYLCIGDKPMISPFLAKQVGKPSMGLSSAGYDLRLGKNYMRQVKTAVAIDPIDSEHQEMQWKKYSADDGEIEIGPLECILAETEEIINMPDDIVSIVLGKSTYARNNILLNTTPLEPCMSADTDVLTDNGWRNISTINVGDMVLTRNKDGIAEYKPVEKVQKREFCDDMLWFNGRFIDQLVTPNHNMFCYFRDCRTNTYKEKILSASQIYKKYNYSLERKVNWVGNDDLESFNVNGREFEIIPFLRFLGCWLGDGSAYKGNDGGYHIKLAVVTKKKKRNDFRRVLEKLGIEKFSESKCGFEFYNKDLCLYLQQFGHAKDKFIDDYVKQLSPRLLEHLIWGLIASDGNIETNTYSTASKRLADDLQEVVLKAGFCAKVRTALNKPSELVNREAVIYKVRICDRHKVSSSVKAKINPLKSKNVKHSGFVYDITVKNHVFLCRRNGKASWTGNCWRGKVTLEIHNCSPVNSVKLRVGSGIAQALFERMANPPARTYSNRESGGAYQDQSGVTTSK